MSLGQLFFVQFLLIVYSSWYAFAKSEPCVFVQMDASANMCEVDYEGINTLDQVKNLVCPFPSLREAMADERMADIIAGKNVFQTIESNDVVRLKKGAGLYVALNPLKKKINKTYKDFYELSNEDFTLNIATYPADVKKGSCANHSTIFKKALPIQEEKKRGEQLKAVLEENKNEEDEDEMIPSKVQTLGVARKLDKIFGDYETVKEDEDEMIPSKVQTLGVARELDKIFGDYETVKERNPRHFEVRKNKEGEDVMCEVSKNSLEERIKMYCSEESRDKECEEGGSPLQMARQALQNCKSDFEKCREGMPPLCSEWKQSDSESPARRNVCISLDDFEKLSGKFFVDNETMQNFCPDDCSYYIQLLQRVRKKEGGHCVENHAIVHCGPEKTDTEYNLNIKVVDDFCEDFNIMCIPKANSSAI